MAIIFTAHAKRRLLQRQIPEEWVQRTLESPDWIAAEPSDLTRAYKPGPTKDCLKRATRILRVVYSVRVSGEILVITAFPDRDAQLPV